MSIQVEFLGGPLDGTETMLEDTKRIYQVTQPPMTPAEFITAQERPDLIAFSTMKPITHSYARTNKIAKGGGRIFLYAGIVPTP
jgi:hypothetical protein